ncbi:hypothetical protein LBMAG42_29960 [Deltaproteobacteria bacterium]|nr:hypothetical protein LBMAG42_29960 [Deltaproteobacteria bacterium]
MVIPPAIGQSDDLHAWLLRGFVEQGLPDVTLGGVVPETGAFNAENLRFNGGVEGVCLCFPGFEPGEEWVYRVAVVGGAGAAVQVTCPDTLFSHAYAGISPQELGGRILADARAHNEAFVAWRAQGGQVSLGEQRAIADARGIPASRGLIELLERRYRAGENLIAGPAAGWWISEQARPTLGAAIKVGGGIDPTYRLKAEAPIHDRPEYREYAASIQSWGAWLIGLGFGAVVISGLALTYAGYNVFQQQASVILTKDISGAAGLLESSAYPLLSFLTSGTFALCWIVAGLRMRALRNLLLVRILLVISMIPCSGACCFVGLPVGGWALYKLIDEKAGPVFGRV